MSGHALGARGGVALVAVLAIGALGGWGITSALGSGAPPNTGASASPATPAKEKVTKNAGKVSWAVVQESGTKQRSFPTSITTVALGTGEYEVISTKNISGCAFTGSLGEPESVDEVPGGSLTVAGRNGNADAVFVATFNASGAATNEPFHIAIIC
jgi:hypothetical protein